MKVVIVGAGPKAVAIAARAAAWRKVLRLHKSKRTVPVIEIIERHVVGSAWIGGHGFTDGKLELCNPGEKDVGFPYTAEGDVAIEAEVSREIARSFSWFSFLVATGAHTEWVERGRPFPSHARWARYLEWVLGRSKQTVLKGQVVSAEFDAKDGLGSWRVTYDNETGRSSSEAHALVLTGTGPAIALPSSAGPNDGFVDVDTFWDPAIHQRVCDMVEGDIVVIGNGGAAGTVLSHLASLRLAPDVAIISLSPLGALFPRGDGFAERRLFSDPDLWRSLPEQVRRDILSRTDSGVVSGRIKKEVEGSTRIVFRHGRATSVGLARTGELEVDFTLGHHADKIRASIVVAAIGFQPWGLLQILEPLSTPLSKPTTATDRDTRHAVEAAFGPDLCIPGSAGLGPRLHVPVLSAFAQGPGFASLGSLGKTASAILDPYVI